MSIDVDKWRRGYDSLASVKIEIVPKNGFYKLFLYKNSNKDASGLMEITTTTENLIESTMYILLHTICDDKSLKPEFSPVIRSVEHKKKIIITVFKFDKKYIPRIKKLAEKLAELYDSKCLVQKIDFKKHYSSVMTNRKFAK
jgi:hypothetical protein